MKMILASNNAKKLRELKAILSDMGVELCSQREAGCDFEVEETGTTFAENAYLKAAAVVEATGVAAIADDSGLMVDALNGEPGVYSARYAPGGHDASDKEKYEYLLKKLEGVKDRDAKFVSSICCIFPNGDIIRCEGECAGKILLSPRVRAASATTLFLCRQATIRAWPSSARESKTRYHTEPMRSKFLRKS